ncbi:uncharacterized protein LOC129171211 [Dunckerocampus dactyliophorus]|uniref:uncharacterized protein LOC129171211 n=1 Tax=Dunckerocampus dactyliophorus TaxID=161453 RepID=UPI002404C717|nr:uncharacterized protein LOC129171211 [Dunckerocampus dactyliophorus]
MCVSAMEATSLQAGSCDTATVHVKREEGEEKQSALVLGSQHSPAPCSDPVCRGGEELGDSSQLHTTNTATPTLLSPVMPSAPPEKTLPLGSDFSSKAVLCLIEAVGRRWGLYETRERSQLFQSVQEELAAKGHMLPVERIRRKWNNLIVTYKRVKDRSRETGQAKTSWEFFDLMDATLCDTVGSYISNKRSKGGSAMPTQAPAKVTPKLHIPSPTTIIHPNGNFSTPVHVESGAKAHSAASVSNSDAIATVRQTESPDLKPLMVLNSDIVTNSLHLASTDPPPSFISSSCFTHTASPSLGSDLNTPRKALSFPTDVICFRRGQNLTSNFPSTSSSIASSVSTPATAGPEVQKANEEHSSTPFYREIFKKREEQTHLDGVAHGRVEARERRRERREMRMAKSLCRIATALELLSSKQDTVIALLQRLADKK